MVSSDYTAEVLPWALAALLAGVIIGAAVMYALGFGPSPQFEVRRDESGHIVGIEGM